jgi:NodT family efflux transporter outer membrane factor (OMF) lipoprotein
VVCIGYASCKAPAAIQVPAVKEMPATYNSSTDTTNAADISWRVFFQDKNLVELIDSAIHNNPDLSITLQEIEIARNKVKMRNAELYPSVSAGGALSIEKVGRYTSQGAGDASAEITPGKIVPEHLPDMFLGLNASWEVDIWGKLRSAKKAAFAKYLGSIEGRNFVLTNLIAEVANSYYELLALDNQLEIIRQTIQLQQNQLEIVKVQKEAAVVTELAVKQFEAQLLNSRSLEFDILQGITENENRINFLLGRYPQKINRDDVTLKAQVPSQVLMGIPSQLLKNRPDIKQAELELLAANWDLKTAQLAFLPSLNISGMLGFQAFKPSFLFTFPESLAYSLIGDIAGPIINRNAIKAEFRTANAYQIEAMYNYQKMLLGGYIEVNNELSNISNLEKLYNLKSKEVETLTKSIGISTDLFKSARANYLEVLTAQRDALSSNLELIDVKKRQLNAVTNMYKALGGGWK